MTLIYRFSVCACLILLIILLVHNVIYAQNETYTTWLPEDIYISGFAWSTDESLIAVASDKGVWLREVNSARLQEITDYASKAVALNSLNSQIAYDIDNSIQLYDLKRQLTTFSFEGHTQAINEVIFNSEGTILFSASDDKTIRIWNTQSGNGVATLVHDSEVKSIALSYDGLLLASGTRSGTIYVWNLGDNKQKYILKGHSDSINDITFSPNGALIATASNDETAGVWDTKTGIELSKLTSRQLQLPQYTQGPVNKVAFSPDGNMLATGTRSLYEHIRLWDVRTGKQFAIIENVPAQDIVGLKFSLDSSKLIEVDELAVRLWDLNNQIQISTLLAVGKDTWDMFLESYAYFDLQSLRSVNHVKYGDPVISMAISQDMQYLLVGRENNTPELLDVGSGEVIWKLSGHSAYITSVALSLNGRYALTASLDGVALLWDLESQNLIHTFSDSSAIKAVAFSPDSEYILIASSAIQLWRLSDFTSVFETQLRLWPSIVSFSPESDYGFTAAWDGIGAYKLDLKTGEIVDVFPYPDEISSLSASFDGQYLVAGGDRIAMLWDVKSGKAVQMLVGHTAPITSVAFAPTSLSILTGSKDGTARQWDALTGKAIQLYSLDTDTVNTVLFSPDEKLVIAGCSDGSIRIWDLNGEPLKIF